MITSDYYILKRNSSELKNLKVRVDLIYLDPPFNLSRRFHMEEKLGFDDYWENEEQYIEWYSNLIVDCYNALNKNGTIYCHNNFINNALVLAKLPTNVRKSFDTNISWKRSHPHNNIKNSWGNITDSILVFKKGNPYFNVEYSPLNSAYEENSFNNKDEKGCYSLSPITGEKSRKGYSFEFKGYNPTYGWRKPLEEITKLDSENMIHYGQNKPYLKKYLSESKGVPVQNFWHDIHPITRTEKNKREYPTQKPVKLLERIIKASCPPKGIVLDPFCGSGTTMLATLNLGLDRKCITSDINDDALNICKANMMAGIMDINEDGNDIWPK